MPRIYKTRIDQFTGIKDKQTRWHLRNLARGCCVTCGKPRDPNSKRFCTLHLRKHWETMRPILERRELLGIAVKERKRAALQRKREEQYSPDPLLRKVKLPEVPKSLIS